MPDQLRKLLRLVGLLATLAAFMFVFESVRQSWTQIGQELVQPRFLWTLAWVSAANGLMMLLIGLAWWRLLNAGQPNSFSLRIALGLFARTQVLKYLPTNTLHFIGRFALAKKAGANNTALVYAQTAEIMLLPTTAVAIGICLGGEMLTELMRDYTPRPVATYWLVLPLIAAFMAAIGLLVQRLPAFVSLSVLRSILTAGLFYSLFCLGIGMLLQSILWGMQAENSVSLNRVVAATVIAWLLGFIVPGAPGGLGVREAVLISGLEAQGVDSSSAVVAAFGHRISSIAGDAILYIIGVALIRGAYGDDGGKAGN